MSSGDKTLGENYLQHADHFMRILEDKNKNKDQNKTETTSENSPTDKSQPQDNNIKQEDLNKSKE